LPPPAARATLGERRFSVASLGWLQGRAFDDDVARIRATVRQHPFAPRGRRDAVSEADLDLERRLRHRRSRSFRSGSPTVYELSDA
jgi:hypothetical protein